MILIGYLRKSVRHWRTPRWVRKALACFSSTSTISSTTWRRTPASSSPIRTTRRPAQTAGRQIQGPALPKFRTSRSQITTNIFKEGPFSIFKLFKFQNVWVSFTRSSIFWKICRKHLIPVEFSCLNPVQDWENLYFYTNCRLIIAYYMKGFIYKILYKSEIVSRFPPPLQNSSSLSDRVSLDTRYIVFTTCTCTCNSNSFR